MKSCAEFANDYKAYPKLAENLYIAWAEGFLSGVNFEVTVWGVPARRLASLNMSSNSSRRECETPCKGGGEGLRGL
jgi:hypothetical protein